MCQPVLWKGLTRTAFDNMLGKVEKQFEDDPFLASLIDPVDTSTDDVEDPFAANGWVSFMV